MNLKERFRHPGARRDARATAISRSIRAPRHAPCCARLVGPEQKSMPRSTSSTSTARKSRVVATAADGRRIRSSHLVFATGYEFPKSVPQRGHTIASTWAIATVPQRRRLWPGECMIWEAADPYLYVRTTPEGRVICGGEDEEFSDEEKRDALLARKTATLQRKLKQLLPRHRHPHRLRLDRIVRAELDRPADHRTDPAHAELLGGARLRRQRHDLFADCSRRHCGRSGRAAGCRRRPLRIFARRK